MEAHLLALLRAAVDLLAVLKAFLAVRVLLPRFMLTFRDLYREDGVLSGPFINSMDSLPISMKMASDT